MSLRLGNPDLGLQTPRLHHPRERLAGLNPLALVERELRQNAGDACRHLHRIHPITVEVDDVGETTDIHQLSIHLVDGRDREQLYLFLLETNPLLKIRHRVPGSGQLGRGDQLRIRFVKALVDGLVTLGILQLVAQLG